MEPISFKIATDFTDTPGPRRIEEGEYSAEELLKKHLFSLFDEAFNRGVKLRIDLDGTYGYATSFLEGTFGELARRYGTSSVQKILEIISTDTPFYKEEAEQYIKDVAES